MLSTLIWFSAAAVSAVAFASLFEWLLHRYVMHRPVGPFDYPFRTHALIHHHVFRADESYHVQRDEDREIIPMAWWNGPVLVALGCIPYAIAGWALGHWEVVPAAAVVFALYYGVYEYLHWCMHLPRRRRVERSGIFFRLNGHHLLHHRYMHKNFNVVLPLADLCLGTLLPRARTHFAQARGPSVPNVQPLTPEPVPVAH
ncbi:MAG: sterol desaturase family protein [Verrucomicrobiae bacterium]|nr:sterol desaturase family protein [Verrucomicrobiae bacterium]